MFDSQANRAYGPNLERLCIGTVANTTRRDSDETHISTFEPSSQTPPRLPRAHGHQSWP